MYKRLLSILLVLSILSTLFSACSNKPVDATSLDIVVDGGSEYVIVRGNNACSSEVTASTELQSYLKQISGAEIPIVTDATEPVKKEIVVGKTNREAEGEFDREELGNDGFIIKTKGEKLFLVGGEQRGSLYAVYEFLEDYIGCRFYTAEVERVPEIKNISIEKIEEDKQIPQFKYRFIGWKHYYGDSDLLAKRRFNFQPFSGGPSEEYGGKENYSGGHTFQWMLPVEEYFAEHPEYYSMDENGVRGYGSEHLDQVTSAYTQLCLSNPEVVDILTEFVRNWIIENPSVQIFHVSNNDNFNYCKCDNCMAIYNEEGGSISGTLIRLLNHISEEVSEELNGRYLMTFAYQHSQSAPLTAPAENIIIQFCPSECCVAHPVASNCPSDPEKETKADGSNKLVTEDFEDWTKLTNNIMIYSYNMNWPHADVFLADLNNMYEDFQYFKSHNINGYFWQGFIDGNSTTFNELKCYLASKLTWDSDMTKEEYYSHMDDFLEGVYGPGWKSIKEYILLAQEEFAVQHCTLWDDPYKYYQFEIVENIHSKDSYPEEITEDMIRNYQNYDWTVYYNWFNDAVPLKVITEGDRLFAEALAAAETDHQRQIIERTTFQLDYLRSYYLALKWNVGVEVQDEFTDFTYIRVKDSWNGAVNRILTNFYKANPDMFSKQEFAQYRVAITKYVAEKVYSSYIQYNKNLLADMQKYDLILENVSGVYNIHEELDDIAFTYVPEYWLEAQKLYGGQ